MIRFYRGRTGAEWDQLVGSGASPVDLLVAVTAQHHKLTVLHQDSDFETMTRATGQPVRRILD
nr:hypothetical protein [Streptomyces scabichelini]